MPVSPYLANPLANPPAQPPRPVISTLRTGMADVTRMRSDAALPPGPPIPVQGASSLIVQLRPFEAHTLWRGGRKVFAGGHDEGAVAITNLQDNWRCQHRSGFDNLRLQIDDDALQALARENGARKPVVLRNPHGAVDPILLSLARAFVPVLDAPARGGQMFLDHLTNAVFTHVLHAYSEAPPSPARAGRLSNRQEALAREFLAAHAADDVSVADLAERCQLSRSHFIKAFKATTGRTPYRWLIEYRVERAKTLLLGDAPIAQIAHDCGFSDQSHFTRIFSALVGTPPARWRRQRQAG